MLLAIDREGRRHHNKADVCMPPTTRARVYEHVPLSFE